MFPLTTSRGTAPRVS
ncbi:hypothetical protein E2C01_048394 [Portunus trituberculatus]|uniref:Uncharacterized protein n=1 Tax=Portunus trituberculatus TaxID=210409 RepID=A0A5B7GAF7_PORTR|nr:hypothetical protein [Portunus trituberculatus]